MIQITTVFSVLDFRSLLSTDIQGTVSLIGVLLLIFGVLGAVFWYRKRRKRSLQRVYPQFSALRDDVRQYIGKPTPKTELPQKYGRYLAQHDRQRMKNSSEKISSEFTPANRWVDTLLFVGKDRERLSEIYHWIGEIDDWLANSDQYNEDFVKRQRKRCEALFQDIGGDKIDLDIEQQRAVVRNDTYNQVTASAGTGKTVVLVTRIAYLIRELGVEPDRILAFTYTREASREIEERLGEEFGITDVNVQTIHAFGYGLLSDTNLHIMDGDDVQSFIRDTIRHETTQHESEFLEHYYDFLAWHNGDYPSKHDFEDREAYTEARKLTKYRTLQGEKVSSRDEKRIADFLFRHQIEYEHEYHVEWADVSDNKGKYEVDFYLPDAEVYIEHWGIDEAGEVAPWFDQTTAEYHEKIHWAREQFADAEKPLVETHHFEYRNQSLKPALRVRLQTHGVEFDQLSHEELVDEVFEYNHEEGRVITYFSRFLSNAKTFDVRPGEIERELDREEEGHYHFNKCGIYLYKEYQKHLVEHDLSDFADMIYEALAKVEENPAKYQKQYDHILIDEFQDIGAGQRELINRLSGVADDTSTNATRLFAVGDDWQSIYSFQGAVVDYFINFKEYFGKPTRTDLLSNYRCPKTIVEASSDVISNNTKQLDKTVDFDSSIDTTPRIHELSATNWHNYVDLTATRGADLCEQYLRDVESEPGDIMILCRYDEALPILSKIRSQLRERGIPYRSKSHDHSPSDTDRHSSVDREIEEGVSVYSIHQSKGREAKHVILTHISSGGAGFPYEQAGIDLLNLVRTINTDTLEEERRLFYVGLTRSAGTLDLLTWKQNPSQFIEEIEEYCDRVTMESITELPRPTTTSTTGRVAKLFDPSHPDMRQMGIVEVHGESIKFVTWERHDPPSVEEGEWYKLKDFRFRNFRGEPQLQYTGSSELVCREKEPNTVTSADIVPMDS